MAVTAGCVRVVCVSLRCGARARATAFGLSSSSARRGASWHRCAHAAPRRFDCYRMIAWGWALPVGSSRTSRRAWTRRRCARRAAPRRRRGTGADRERTAWRCDVRVWCELYLSMYRVSVTSLSNSRGHASLTFTASRPEGPHTGNQQFTARRDGRGGRRSKSRRSWSGDTLHATPPSTALAYQRRSCTSA